MILFEGRLRLTSVSVRGWWRTGRIRMKLLLRETAAEGHLDKGSARAK